MDKHDNAASPGGSGSGGSPKNGATPVTAAPPRQSPRVVGHTSPPRPAGEIPPYGTREYEDYYNYYYGEDAAARAAMYRRVPPDMYYQYAPRGAYRSAAPMKAGDYYDDYDDADEAYAREHDYYWARRANAAATKDDEDPKGPSSPVTRSPPPPRGPVPAPRAHHPGYYVYGRHAYMPYPYPYYPHPSRRAYAEGMRPPAPAGPGASASGVPSSRSSPTTTTRVEDKGESVDTSSDKRPAAPPRDMPPQDPRLMYPPPRRPYYWGPPHAMYARPPPYARARGPMPRDYDAYEDYYEGAPRGPDPRRDGSSRAAAGGIPPEAPGPAAPQGDEEASASKAPSEDEIDHDLMELVDKPTLDDELSLLLRDSKDQDAASSTTEKTAGPSPVPTPGPGKGRGRKSKTTKAAEEAKAAGRDPLAAAAEALEGSRSSTKTSGRGRGGGRGGGRRKYDLPPAVIPPAIPQPEMGSKAPSPVNGSSSDKAGSGESESIDAALEEAVKPEPQPKAATTTTTTGKGKKGTKDANANSESKPKAAKSAEEESPLHIPKVVEMPGLGLKSVQSAKAKNGKHIEAYDRRIWTQIVRRDVPRVNRVVQQAVSTRLYFQKRIATITARESRRHLQRFKTHKDVAQKGKKLVREMLVHWKSSEKNEREQQKKAEREAQTLAKKEEDERESKRQARKLNFLITQTELYSHFVGSKMKGVDGGDNSEATQQLQQQPTGAAQHELSVPQDHGNPLQDLDFDDEDGGNAALHARRNAEAAVQAAKDRAAAFDSHKASSSSDPEALAAEAAAQGKSADALAFDSLEFQNPGGITEIVKQPTFLTCKLKEYQLKGLTWLANLYEQGINGILADEMGLGKTVQSISLMAYLAEVHDIWGPFLIIAPASTLHNWQQEITKFVPSLKALPYWGAPKDRATLRKFMNRKSVRYDRDAPFHILVTSYQIIVQDEKYLNRIRWQYMVLDEAQAIKSSSSARWKTLLKFHCRNRLLLTGTPIQNSMTELWALLHFIMPTLFDSHDEFSEWFSKDIESNSENKAAMNEHQLRRLHMILKPFMLRRIKKNVQNELGDKIEIDLFCNLTARQRQMYQSLRHNLSVSDLVSSNKLGDDDSLKRLMNLIMQFRKVCNHPELFERADVRAPFAFANAPLSNAVARPKDSDTLNVTYSCDNPVALRVPRLLYHDGLLPGGYRAVHVDKRPDTHLYLSFLEQDGILEKGTAEVTTTTTPVVHDESPVRNVLSPLDHLFNIYHPSATTHNPAFTFASVFNTPVHSLSQAASLELASDATAAYREARVSALASFVNADDNAPTAAAALASKHNAIFDKTITLPHTLTHLEESYRADSRLNDDESRFFMPAAVAPPPTLYCADADFAQAQGSFLFDPAMRRLLYGVDPALEDEPRAVGTFVEEHPGVPSDGLIAHSSLEQLGFPSMHVPQLKKLILDSGKLARLDSLLTELKAGGHRVLIYFQMTKMIDLMDEYLTFRQYRYLRLDGTSSISERRDMVTEWQTDPDIFIFLLSTKAGGLGINLTAADTVIFYDSDWNPSNDLQAMDRAHRLGQTRQVTVYRLITRGTVDERIVRLARAKKNVQDAVVGSSATSYVDTAAKPNEVMSLLLDEDDSQPLGRGSHSGPSEVRYNGTANPAVENGKSDTEKRAADDDAASNPKRAKLE